MRIALISDIHGNLVALDAVLADLDTQSVAQVICLGDLALSGPEPHGCVTRIRERGIPTIRGNCDDLSLAMRTPDGAAAHAPGSGRWAAWVGKIDVWSARALTDDDACYLASLPMTSALTLDDGMTLLCAHGSPRSYNHRLLPETPVEQLAEMIGPVAANALAVGHTHTMMRRQLGPLTIVNPGSVGLPMAPDASGTIINPADYAEYGILSWKAGALTWEPCRVPLNADAVFAAARASGMPHADHWRGDWSRP